MVYNINKVDIRIQKENRRVYTMNRNKMVLTGALALFMSFGCANALTSGPFGYDLQKDMHRNDGQQQQQQQQEQNQSNQVNQTSSNQQTSSSPAVTVPTAGKDFYSFVPMKDLYIDSIDKNVYYPNATMGSAIAKYKRANYAGCLQEIYSYIKKHPNDVYAYYYMGLAYTRIGEKDAAKNAFQKAINCNAHGKLLLQSLKGRDCITGGTYCHAFDQNPSANLNTGDDLDKFINAPYKGNGFSPELEQQYKQQQLNNLQKTINRKDNLNRNDFSNIDRLNNKFETFVTEKLAMAADINSEPSSEEVMNAIDVLKRAGLNISASTDEKKTL